MQPGPVKKPPPRSLASWIRVAVLFQVRVVKAAGRHIRDRLLLLSPQLSAQLSAQHALPPPPQTLPSSQHRLSHVAASSPDMASSSSPSSSSSSSSSSACAPSLSSSPSPPDLAGESFSLTGTPSNPATQSGDSSLSPAHTANQLQRWLPLQHPGSQTEHLEEDTYTAQSNAASAGPANTHPFEATATTSAVQHTTEAAPPEQVRAGYHRSSALCHNLDGAQAQELRDTSQSQAEAQSQSQTPSQSQAQSQSQVQAGEGHPRSRGATIEEAQEGVGDGRSADETPKGESEGDSLMGQGSAGRFCRICFEGEESRQLIAPCQCKGTQKYVHRSCLDSWRSAKEGFAFAHCTECRAAFVLSARVPPDRYWRKLQFRACIALDHAVLFVSVQIVVAAVASITFLCLGDQLSSQLGYQDRPDSFFLLAAVLSIAVGILYGFFIAIICSEHIERRHAYILQRQALTQEYFVEDLEENLSPSRKLLPEHEQELVSLGLM